MSNQSGRACPFLTTPFDECHVNDMNSQNIPKAIYYCSLHHEECEIYKRNREANQSLQLDKNLGIRG